MMRVSGRYGMEAVPKKDRDGHLAIFVLESDGCEAMPERMERNSVQLRGLAGGTKHLGVSQVPVSM